MLCSYGRKLGWPDKASRHRATSQSPGEMVSSQPAWSRPHGFEAPAFLSYFHPYDGQTVVVVKVHALQRISGELYALQTKALPH